MLDRRRYFGIIEKYRDHLPVADDTRVISLGEGDTPLIRLENIPRQLGTQAQIYVKFEGMNPTGSFKDRGKAVICASTGNTSASAAAYAARAGLTAFVLIPEGKIALGKLAQAMMHGAVVLQIKGNFDAGMRLVKEVATEAPVTIVNSINPFRIQGQKTAAFEVVEALGREPDYHCLPVGNAGNITSYWLGYSEYHRQGMVRARPRMCGYQATGAAPFLRGHMVDAPETVATAIRIGRPQSWERAWTAQTESEGWFDECTDEEILAAQKLLAQREGIFCEPASAVSIAGALRDLGRAKIPDQAIVVCTLTGHGLKDPDVAVQQSRTPLAGVEAVLDSVKDTILGYLEQR
jgi:threonine synthase